MRGGEGGGEKGGIFLSFGVKKRYCFRYPYKKLRLRQKKEIRHKSQLPLKNNSEKGLDILSSVCYNRISKRAWPSPKGGQPMSTLEVIALLTLVIAAVSLGNQIKK